MVAEKKGSKRIRVEMLMEAEENIRGKSMIKERKRLKKKKVEKER